MVHTAFRFLHKALARRQDFMQKRRRLQMKHNKETTPSTEKEREDFWLEIGPASAYYGTDSYETARENGDASPDGKRLGFDGAEPGTGPRGAAPDSPALEPWDDLPPIDRP